MMHVGGTKSWFTAAELAELALPGLPSVKRKINELADSARWKLRDGGVYCRPRSGRGGGVEYNIALLPPSASLELMRRGLAAPIGTVQAPPRDQLWAWFDGQTKSVKDEARRRLKAIEQVEAMVDRHGLTVTAAVTSVAAELGISTSSLYQWRGFAQGRRLDDRLPALAPRRVGGGAQAEIDPEVWRAFLSAYLNPSAPTAAACYGWIKPKAAQLGVALPHLKTFMRKIDREIDPRLVAAKRCGQDALRAMVPHQKRSVADLQALELVNIDGHKWDVFVKWPDGTTHRPIMVAIQDVYSRKFLAWRVGTTESVTLTRLTFADLFRRWGIPDGCLLDNGRAFASKHITGGAKTRNRFKIKDEDPIGLLTALGVKTHWALPYRGSSKPIERGFRDFCNSIAKHPAFSGAYTGNRPDAKPENYGERTIDLETFVQVVNAGIAAHNQKTGRDTEICRKRLSFDEAFEASYARSTIRQAGAEQLRLALLAGEQLRAQKNTGEIVIYGNRYWSEALYAVAGQNVTVRFDPDHLQRDAEGNDAVIFVYDDRGAFVGEAKIQFASGFLDQASAQAKARLEKDVRRKARALADAENLMTAAEVAAWLPSETYDDEDEQPRPAAIRPVRPRGRAVAVLRTSAEPARASVVDRLTDAFADPSPTPIKPRFAVLDGGLE